MSMNRALRTVVSIVLVLTTLSACSSGGGIKTASNSEKTTTVDESEKVSTSTSTPDDLYQIDMYNTYANYMGLQSGWFGKIVRDKFNIELNIIAPNVDGTGDALYQTRTAAGNLGDVIVQTKDRMLDCYDAGLLLNMKPYLDDSPNLAKLNTAIDSCSAFIGGDGIYAIPGRVSSYPATEPAGRGLNPESAAYLRWDWYVEAGAPEIKNLDSLLEVLDNICEAHPTNENGDKVYAFSLFKDWDGESMRTARDMMCLYGYGTAYGMYWMNSDGSDIVNLADDEGLYYQILKMYNKANTMGILDPDSATQNWDMVDAKFRDGRILYSWWPFLGRTIHDKFDVDNYKPYAVVPITDSVVNNPGYNPYGMESNAFAIGVGAKYPERIMEFLDWYASPEGVLVSNGLIEGVTYEMKEGKPELTEFGLNTDPNKTAPAELGGGNWTDGGCQINYPLVHADDINLLINEPTNSNLWASTIKSNSNVYTEKWTELYDADSPLDYLKTHNMIEVAPGTDYTAPPIPSDIQTMRSQIGELFDAASWKMVYAKSDEEFESIWKDMKTQLPDFGFDKVMEYDMGIVNQMIDSRTKVLKNQ